MVAGTTGWYILKDTPSVPEPNPVEQQSLTAPISTDTTSIAAPTLTLDSTEKEKPATKNPVVATTTAPKKTETPKKSSELKKAEPNPNAIYHVVDEDPSFPGGESAMRSWLSRNRRVPEAAERAMVAGVVRVSFRGEHGWLVEKYRGNQRPGVWLRGGSPSAGEFHATLASRTPIRKAGSSQPYDFDCI